jgi:signal transduction histidine kinase
MKKKTIDFLFLSAFAIIGISLLFASFSFNKLDNSSQLVDHSYIAKDKIMILKSKFKSMLYNQRTYLLAEDPYYLTKHKKKKEKIEELFHNLENQIKDNPEQLSKLKTLRNSYILCIRALEHELTILPSDPESIKRNIKTSTKYAEHFIETAESMELKENNLLYERLKSQSKEMKITPVAFSTLGMLSFAVVAFAFFRQKIDLNDKEELLKNKRQLLKRLLDSNTSLEEYAYIASHDLQEPLRKIQIFTDTANLALERSQHEEVKKYLLKIDQSSKEARKMILGLLEHSHMDRNKDPLSLIRVSDLFQEVAAEYRIAHKPDISFDIKINHTPAIMVYKSQILELLRNLFSNAVRFRKPGGVVSVSLNYEEVTSKDGERFDKISISDQGIGFDPSNSKLIFEMFSKLSLHKNSKRNNLGLSLCKKIMENHGGSITAESKEGIGTTFHLFFSKDGA